MQNLENKLKEIIKTKVGESELAEIIDYAMFPAGKLFRPMLVMAMGEDTASLGDDHYLLAAAVEAHHAYSLVHDDLPCMDNDDMRRGKPATHKKYGEWKALLAGDAMINLSFELLADIQNDKAKNIIGDFAKMMGARGLILGQFIDLSHEKKTLEQTLLMHELKTARLIQFSLMGALELSNSPIPKSEVEEFGMLMGVNFQILDDLGELTEETDEHEEQVNAFLNYDSAKVLSLAIENNSKIFSIIEKRQLKNLGKMYSAFLDKTLVKIKGGMDSICSKTGLSPEDFNSLLQ